MPGARDNREESGAGVRYAHAADEARIKTELIGAMIYTIRSRKLTQVHAAKLCGTDQPTLSKVVRGRMESVTIDKLLAWLTALGRTVEIQVKPDVDDGVGRITIRSVS